MHQQRSSLKQAARQPWSFAAALSQCGWQVFLRSRVLVFQRRCSCRVLPVGGLGSCAWNLARQETNVNSQIEGRCLCGAVRFIARGEPTEVSWCHCRRHTGAPASAFVAFRREAYAVSEGEITKFNSSPGRLRGFCARCGSTMTCEGVKPYTKFNSISAHSHMKTPPGSDRRNSFLPRNACRGSIRPMIRHAERSVPETGLRASRHAWSSWRRRAKSTL